MKPDQSSEARDLRVRELASRYGLPEEKVRGLLHEHSDEGSLSDALTNLAHFLRAPS
jgi:hypothetical protein